MATTKTFCSQIKFLLPWVKPKRLILVKIYSYLINCAQQTTFYLTFKFTVTKEISVSENIILNKPIKKFFVLYFSRANVTRERILNIFVSNSHYCILSRLNNAFKWKLFFTSFNLFQWNLFKRIPWIPKQLECIIQWPSLTVSLIDKLTNIVECKTCRAINSEIQPFGAYFFQLNSWHSRKRGRPLQVNGNCFDNCQLTWVAYFAFVSPTKIC